MEPNPLLEKLGYGTDARLVIFHADDLGMSHSANQAFLELFEAGIVRSGSVMMPCPWTPEMCRLCRADPALDVGVHITLTSEWSNYRWGPVSSQDVESGLLDAERRFWPGVESLVQHMDPEAAAQEMRAQIELALSNGVDVTHLDAHQGSAMTPALVQAYAQLGVEFGLPIFLPRRIDSYLRQHSSGVDEEQWLMMTSFLESSGMTLVDWFRITPLYHLDGDPGPPSPEAYESVLRELQPGVTYFSLHPSAPGDIELIAPDDAAWRIFEHSYFQSQRLADFLAAEEIIPIGFREIRAVLRSG
jgi:hypothetical protein